MSESVITINLIRYDGNKSVHIWYTEDKEDGDTQIHKLKSEAKPTAAFKKDLKSLVPHILDLMELPDAMIDDTTVTSVAIFRDSGARSIVMKGFRELSTNERRMKLETPTVSEEEDDSMVWDFVDELTEEALKYLGGEHEHEDVHQPGLFDEKEEADG